MIKKQGLMSLIAKFSIADLVNFVIGFLSVFVLTRIFAPDEYGYLNLFNSASATVLSMMYLGLDSSFIRYFNEPPNNNCTQQFCFQLIFISLMATFITGTIISAFFYKDFSTKMFGISSRFLCIALFIYVFAQLIIRYLNIIYRMKFNTKMYTIQNILVYFSIKCFVMLSALFKCSLNGIIIFNIGGVSLLTLVYAVIQKKDFIPSEIKFNFKGYQAVFKFALFSAPLTLALSLNTFLIQSIIVRKMGLSFVGLYASANYFVTIFSALKGGFGTFWSAYMYANYNTEQEKIISVHDYIMFALIFVFLCMILFKDFIYLFIGAEYHASKSFFALLLISPILSFASQTTLYGLCIEEKNHIMLFDYLCSLSANILICLWLIPHMGLKGAAFSSAVSSILLFVLDTVNGQRYYKSIDDGRRTMNGVITIVLLAVISAFVKNIFLYWTGILFILLCSFYVYRQQCIDIYRWLRKLIICKLLF